MLKFRSWGLSLPLLHPPWGVQAQVSESWLFWFLKRAVVHKNSSSGAERCLGHGGWDSPLPEPGCIIQPAAHGREDGYRWLSAQARVVHTSGERTGSHRLVSWDSWC